MRITKELTSQIVKELVSPITVKIEENKQSVSDIVRELILAECPPEIFRLWENKSKFIITRGAVSINYLGHWDRVSFDHEIPCAYDGLLIEKGQDADKIQSIVNESIKLSDKKYKLSKELEVAILKLGTYARIRAQFPEVAALLPDENKMEIALNIQDTRNKLKNLP